MQSKYISRGSELHHAFPLQNPTQYYNKSEAMSQGHGLYQHKRSTPDNHVPSQALLIKQQAKQLCFNRLLKQSWILMP